MFLALTTVCLLMSQNISAQAKDPLLFPKNNFTVETKTVNTSAGEKKGYLPFLYAHCLRC